MERSTPESGGSPALSRNGGARISAVAEQLMEPSHTPYPVIVAALLLATMAPCLGDDVEYAKKPRPTAYALCGNDGARLPGCKDGPFDRLGREVDTAVKAALAKALPPTVPILMRDQFWFREMIGTVMDDATRGGDDQLEVQKRTLDNVVATLHQRIATLHAIAQGSAAPASPGAGPTHSGRSRYAGRTRRVPYRAFRQSKLRRVCRQSAANVQHRCGGALRCQRMALRQGGREP